MKLVIVDYGMGNLKSISGALRYLDVKQIVISNKLSDITSASKIILPGVGSFAKAMENIKNFKIDSYLYDAVISNKKPILGICLGMQLMAEKSEEGEECGLGFIPADVVKFNTENLKVPHVGFNQVSFFENSRLYEGIDDLSDFYFAHSFQMQSNKNINKATCNYGNEFIASFELDNIAGVQFHPELSQTNGLRLLDNFLKNY